MIRERVSSKRRKRHSKWTTRENYVRVQSEAAVRNAATSYPYEMALEMLSRKEIVSLDEERKANMMSNLLVVLCGEKGAQPMLNTSTIQQ